MNVVTIVRLLLFPKTITAGGVWPYCYGREGCGWEDSGLTGEGAWGILVPINQRLHTMTTDPLMVWESHSDRSHHNNGATPASSAKLGSNLPVQGCWKYDQEKELRWTFMLGHIGNVNQLRWREHLIRHAVRFYSWGLILDVELSVQCLYSSCFICLKLYTVREIVFFQ